MIKMYTKNICPKCLGVKARLDYEMVEYEAINIDENEVAKQLVLAQGFMVAPVMEIDGEFIGDFGLINEKIDELVG